MLLGQPVLGQLNLTSADAGGQGGPSSVFVISPLSFLLLSVHLSSIARHAIPCCKRVYCCTMHGAVTEVHCISANTALEQSTVRVSISPVGSANYVSVNSKIVGTVQSRPRYCARPSTPGGILDLLCPQHLLCHWTICTVPCISTTLWHYSYCASFTGSRLNNRRDRLCHGANKGRGDHKRYDRTTSSKRWPAKVRYMQVLRPKVATIPPSILNSNSDRGSSAS